MSFPLSTREDAKKHFRDNFPKIYYNPLFFELKIIEKGYFHLEKMNFEVKVTNKNNPFQFVSMNLSLNLLTGKISFC